MCLCVEQWFDSSSQRASPQNMRTDLLHQSTGDGRVGATENIRHMLRILQVQFIPVFGYLGKKLNTLHAILTLGFGDFLLDNLPLKKKKNSTNSRPFFGKLLNSTFMSSCLQKFLSVVKLCNVIIFWKANKRDLHVVLFLFQYF